MTTLGPLKPDNPGLIAFDLEGPLSPQDNAYEVMGLTERGYELFERLSRYDDILTIEERPDYEPGDTLFLILPFLIVEGLTRKDILNVSKKAPLTPGSIETIKAFKEKGYSVTVISTSYAPHARYIGAQLGISEEFIACTPFPKDEIVISPEERAEIRTIKNKVLEIPLTDDHHLKRILDEFYLKTFPAMPLYEKLKPIRVVGGRRKVEALEGFIKGLGIPSARTVCIGDSITDFRMLDYLNKAGGLAIVFNGNEYSVPYATIAVAADTLTAIIEPVSLFFEKGTDAVKEFITKKTDDSMGYTLIEKVPDIDRVIAVHKLMRRKIRGRAAQLG